MAKKIVNEIKIIIYTTKTCGYCYLAKNLLKKYYLEYKEIDVSNNNVIKNEMIRKSSGMKTVPQIFFNNTHIGGFYELNQLHLNEGLTKNL
jgi:glutaredoxin 3